MILQFAPLIDQISAPVLGGFVVPVVGVECLNGKGRAKSIPKAYGELASSVPQIVRKTSGKFI